MVSTNIIEITERFTEFSFMDSNIKKNRSFIHKNYNMDG